MYKKLIIMSLLLAMILGGCGFKSGTGEKGQVYYLNFNPEADEAWQRIAKEYTDLTGIQVDVVTISSGQYDARLAEEMRSDNAPTLFKCGTQVDLAIWKDYCLDLSTSDVYKEMITDDFNLKGDNGEVYAIAYCYEAFGIIVNKALLEEAGYDVTQIKSFKSLKNIVEDITSRKEELGFAAFTSSGLDMSSAWRFSGHLANMPLFYEFNEDKIKNQPESIDGRYLDNYKQIWDLYINNATCDKSELMTKTMEDAEAEFARGEAVFFQNGSWEYSNLVTNYGMSPDDLTMIPIYCGVEGEEKAALCCGTENCWAVNSKAAPEDQKATLDFLKWLVTSESGTTMMVEHFGEILFKKAKETSNVFLMVEEELLENGNYAVTWAFNYTPNVETWRAGVVSALIQYSVNEGSWDGVKTAFIDGWSTQYRAQQEN